ncbi:uncharacterized protein LOC124158717 [Ischnura elegans]|uniref:uncharacterized protein LOC124158717 n=1 Tax=Ischnura elegans TaxID=197161 RepID=UPI001ED8757B|nr:uncharacterized protein LOC124158717 [Ischnura elegans]
MARDTKASHGQVSLLIKFMEENKEFARGGFVGPTGRIKNNQMWEQLSDQLNADGSGPTKPAHKWQKTWADLKCYIKKKYSKAKQHAIGTGGGPPCSQLNALEERVLSLMTVEAVEGDSSLEEAGPSLPFQAIPEPEIELEIRSTSHQVQEQNDEGPLPLGPPSTEMVSSPLDNNNPKKRKVGSASAELTSGFISIEERRLAMEERLVQIKEKKVKIEEEKLLLKKKKLDTLKKNHEANLEEYRRRTAALKEACEKLTQSLKDLKQF